MGYRNYLALLKRDDLKNYKQFIEKNTDDCYGLCAIDVVKDMCTEIYEIGKYSEEGGALEEYSPAIPADIVEDFNELKNIFNKNEYGFNYVNKKAMKLLIDSYSSRSGMYFNGLLDSLLEKPNAKATKEEAMNSLIGFLREMANGYKDGSILNTSDTCPYTITDSWKYALTVFNLVHIYKIFNWENDIMVVVGY